MALANFFADGDLTQFEPTSISLDIGITFEITVYKIKIARHVNIEV